MSITGIRELLSRSDASGSKSTILKPLTWFLALIIGGILTLLKFGSPIWLTIMLAVIFCLGVAVFFFVYIYCLINDRDSLRSEKFTIQKRILPAGDKAGANKTCGRRRMEYEKKICSLL